MTRLLATLALAFSASLFASNSFASPQGDVVSMCRDWAEDHADGLVRQVTFTGWVVSKQTGLTVAGTAGVSTRSDGRDYAFTCTVEVNVKKWRVTYFQMKVAPPPPDQEDPPSPAPRKP